MICVVVRYYHLLYPGDFVMWRSTNPAETAEVRILFLSHLLLWICIVDMNTKRKLSLFEHFVSLSNYAVYAGN